MSGPQQLLEGLYRIAGPELTHPWDANGFLLLGDEPALIDCGSSLGSERLVANLAAVGLEPGDVRHVLATHAHWDHLSGGAALQAAGATVWLHEAEVAQAESGDPERTASFLYDELFPVVRIDQVLHGGEAIDLGSQVVHAHHTPGHSPGGVSFLFELDGTRVLIAGDTLWGGFSERVGSDLDAWHPSLQRLVDLEPDVMAVGHAVPGLIRDATPKLREAQLQLGVYLNPWFKPFHVDFEY